MNKHKYLCLALTIIILLCALSIPAYAHEVPDLNQLGEISVTMRCQGNSVPGGSLTIYHVGTVVENDGNYGFELTEQFSPSTVDLQDISSAELADKLAAFAASQNLSGNKQNIDDSGNVVFQDVLPGLYLIAQETGAAGYSKAKPFLVSLPHLKDGSYEYHVDASPKVDLEKEPVTPPPTEPPVPDLPHTGQLNWPIPILVVAGLLLFSIGWVLRYRKGH